MTPVKVDAETEVQASNSCNCSCPSSCCFSLGKPKHKKTCEYAKNKFKEMQVENPTWQKGANYGNAQDGKRG